MAKSNEEMFAFRCSTAVVNNVGNHIDKTKIKLRNGKKPLRFTKKEMFEYLLTLGIKHFDIQEFIQILELEKQKQ